MAVTRGHPFRLPALLGVFALAAAMLLFGAFARAAHAATPTALILGDSVVAGVSPDGDGDSIEQYEAELDGFNVTVVSGTTWDSMTAAQFRSYQVLIIGDPDCGDTNAFQAAVTNEAVWEPQVMNSGGNKALIGTDPVFHYLDGHSGGATLIGGGIAFAGAQAGATGAYVDLSCAYSGSSPGTPVPLLDGLSIHGPGSFTVGGAPCAGSISIIAASGPTSNVHDTDLSGWNCSVHEFFDKFPTDYVPLALATDSSVPVTYTGTDIDTGATVSGSPYIMVSGSGVSITSNLTLTPKSQTLAAGGSATLTANLVDSSGNPISGGSIAFSVNSGPDAGQTGTGTTDSSGNATFTYPDTGGVGTDNISATYTSPSGVTSQALASVTWSGGPDQAISAAPMKESMKLIAARCGGWATFADPDTAATGAEYSASIDWGDGSVSVGTIKPGGTTTGRFEVVGCHKWLTTGSFTVTVTITDTDNTANSATATMPVKITGPIPTAHRRTTTRIIIVRVPAKVSPFAPSANQGRIIIRRVAVKHHSHRRHHRRRAAHRRR